MTEPATDRIMHARMRNQVSLPKQRQTGSGDSSAAETGTHSVKTVVRQGSRFLVTLPASARVVKTKTNHKRGDQAPTTDDMAFDGRK